MSEAGYETLMTLPPVVGLGLEKPEAEDEAPAAAASVPLNADHRQAFTVFTDDLAAKKALPTLTKTNSWFVALGRYYMALPQDDMKGRTAAAKAFADALELGKEPTEAIKNAFEFISHAVAAEPVAADQPASPVALAFLRVFKAFMPTLDDVPTMHRLYGSFLNIAETCDLDSRKSAFESMMLTTTLKAFEATVHTLESPKGSSMVRLRKVVEALPKHSEARLFGVCALVHVFNGLKYYENWEMAKVEALGVSIITDPTEGLRIKQVALMMMNQSAYFYKAFTACMEQSDLKMLPSLLAYVMAGKATAPRLPAANTSIEPEGTGSSKQGIIFVVRMLSRAVIKDEVAKAYLPHMADFFLPFTKAMVKMAAELPVPANATSRIEELDKNYTIVTELLSLFSEMCRFPSGREFFLHNKELMKICMQMIALNTNEVTMFALTLLRELSPYANDYEGTQDEVQHTVLVCKQACILYGFAPLEVSKATISKGASAIKAFYTNAFRGQLQVLTLLEAGSDSAKNCPMHKLVRGDGDHLILRNVLSYLDGSQTPSSRPAAASAVAMDMEADQADEEDMSEEEEENDDDDNDNDNDDDDDDDDDDDAVDRRAHRQNAAAPGPGAIAFEMYYVAAGRVLKLT